MIRDLIKKWGRDEVKKALRKIEFPKVISFIHRNSLPRSAIDAIDITIHDLKNLGSLQQFKPLFDVLEEQWVGDNKKREFDTRVGSLWIEEDRIVIQLRFKL